MAQLLVLPVTRLAGAGVEHVPPVIVAPDDRTGPGRVVVPGIAFVRGKAGSQMLPFHEVTARGVAVADIPVPQLRIADGLVGLQEVAVPNVAIADKPAVPDPFALKRQNHQPLTPVEATDAMKTRWSDR